MTGPAEKEVLLEVKDLNITYGTGRRAYDAVQQANFVIYKGETFGLVGESGSGKTTIGRAILRILPTSGGEILYKGQKINGRISRELDRRVTREIQMIFQDPMASLNERTKVEYIVAEGLYAMLRHIRSMSATLSHGRCRPSACCPSSPAASRTSSPAASASASASPAP